MGAILGAGVLSAGASIYGSTQAAGAQKSAAQQATQAQMAMFNATQGYLSPYRQAGQNALTQQLGMAQKGFNFNPTMQQLAADAGLPVQLEPRASDPCRTARRRVASAPLAHRCAARLTTQAAWLRTPISSSSQTLLPQYQTNYNNLGAISGLGENAAAGTGNAATATGQSIGNNITGAGNATAAADMAMANGVSTAGGNSLMMYMLGNKLGMFGGGQWRRRTPTLKEI